MDSIEPHCAIAQNNPRAHSVLETCVAVFKNAFYCLLLSRCSKIIHQMAECNTVPQNQSCPF